jgi:AcrR family transcriptional regulator
VVTTTDGGSTRDRIREVALELFQTQGFAATSLRHIAERLGITKAALYYHYPSKSELIVSIVEPLLTESDALLDSFEVTPAPRIADVLGGWFDLLERHGELMTALIRDASGFAHVDLEGWVQRLILRMQVLLVGPDASVERNVDVVVAMGGLARVTLLAGPLDRDRVRAEAIAAACRALDIEQDATIPL